MLLLQQARLMQSKIPRPLKYKATSIGDKIQRRQTAPTNNKNNKDISIFFVTQHQLSIIVKHKHIQNTYTKKPTSSLQWILKELSKCLKGFSRQLGLTACYSMTSYAICWPVYFKFATRGCDRKPP